jgi:hypothetical protein
MDGCGSTQKAATRLRPAPTEPDVQDVVSFRVSPARYLRFRSRVLTASIHWVCTQSAVEYGVKI